MNLPALPDPETTNQIALYEACRTVVAWANTCDDIAQVKDVKDKMAAIASYLKQRNASSEAAKAVRRLEKRIGELLPPEQGRRTDLELPPASEEVELSDQRKAEFRKFADPANAEAFEMALAESTDEKPVTKAAVLKAIAELNEMVQRPNTKTPELKLQFLVDMHLNEISAFQTDSIPSGLPIEVLNSIEKRKEGLEVIRQARRHIDRLEKILKCDTSY